jgi:hypothetical protein
MPAGSGVFPKSTGDVIYQGDYNAVQSIIAGVKTTHYGKSCSSSQLAGNPTVTALQFNNLLTDVDSCIKHQTGSNSGLTTRSVGETITYAHINNLKTYADQAETNKNTVYSATQLSQMANQATSSRNGAVSPWNSSIAHTVQVNWSSAAEADYFFNTGGYLYTTASYSGGSTPKDSDWAAVINAIGNRNYTRSNWVTGGTVTIATVGGSGVYSANYWQLSVTKNSSSQVTMTMSFVDAAGPNPNYDENVTLNITSAVGYYKSVDAIVGAVPSSVSTTGNL